MGEKFYVGHLLDHARRDKAMLRTVLVRKRRQKKFRKWQINSALPDNAFGAADQRGSETGWPDKQRQTHGPGSNFHSRDLFLVQVRTCMGKDIWGKTWSSQP